MKKTIKVICLALCGLLMLTACTAKTDVVSSDKTSSEKSDIPSKPSSKEQQSEAASSAIASKEPIIQTELIDEVIQLNGNNYKLTFFDDFLGKSLDTSKWSLCPEQPRQNVGGYWNDECTSLDGNGNLVLAAVQDNGKLKSGAIRSRGKFEQVQGYFECRAKLQAAPGFWGAFWIMSDSMSDPNAPVGDGAKNGVEIDIMESSNVYLKDVNHAIHWDGYFGNTKSLAHTNHNTNCYDGEFHTFSLLWTDTAYIFYIDGKETFKTQSNYDNYPGLCEDPCYLKLTVEFGTWAGEVIPKKMPSGITVDYVKVYQKVS